MQGSGGIGTVISIINGGYDCCPSSTYGRSYGHTAYRVWWF
jgi:basic endochitinase B